MGSMVELNDTLRITKEQGFPVKLDIEKHLKTPYSLSDVADQIFTFSAKPKIRVYQQPPVRNFLAEDLDGKWIYWGQCHILEIHHDYTTGMTSGKYKIIRLNTPEEMRQMFAQTDSRPDFNYFEN